MWFNDYNRTYLISGEVINDAEEYGVLIHEAVDVAPGEMYWKIIGVHHLTPLENRSNHNLYMEALDTNGERVSLLWAGWTWVGRDEVKEPARPAKLDKPPHEPASNITIGGAQIISTWILGLDVNDPDKSDKIANVHTQHPDEPLPDGSLFNARGHHSFYVVFQQTIKEGTEPPTEPPTEQPIKHYVLLSKDISDWEYIIVSRWLVEMHVTSGFNWQEALLAKHITGIGHFEDDIKKILLDSDSEFVLMSGKCALADEIEWLLNSERSK